MYCQINVVGCNSSTPLVHEGTIKTLRMKKVLIWVHFLGNSLSTC